MSSLAKKVLLNSAKSAEKNAAKQAAAAAISASAKSAAKTAAKTDAKLVAKAEAKTAAQEAAELAAKKSAKDVASTAKAAAIKSTGNETKDTALKKAAKFAADNPKLVIGGVAATAIAGASMDKFLARDGKSLTITKIEQVPSSTGTVSSSVKITFTPSFDFQSTDKVSVSGTDCAPDVNGENQVIAKILSKTEILLGRTIARSGSGGTLVTHTSFEAQLIDTTADAAGTAINVAADVGGNVVDNVLAKTGLPNTQEIWASIKSYKNYVIVVFTIIVLLKLYISWPRRR
jgi:hypothetical protein